MSDISNLGNKKIFASNLSYYLKLNDKTPSDVCEMLSIAPSTFSDWLNAKKYPRIDKIELLANYFNIKKSNLIEDKYNNNNISQKEILFNKTKNILSDSDWATIEFIMNKTIEEYEKNKNGG